VEFTETVADIVFYFVNWRSIFSYSNNQTSFRLDKLIHNNSGIKML